MQGTGFGTSLTWSYVPIRSWRATGRARNQGRSLAAALAGD